MTKDEALKLALEALEEINKLSIGENAICLPAEIDTAMDAIREALAQPEQEPVAWANRVIGGKKWLSIHASKGASDKWLEYRRKEQAQGEQYEQIALYTTPPHRKPLTDEEIEVLAKKHNGIYYDCDITFARAIEAKLKEKNGG